MNECLHNICQTFEGATDFLTDKSQEKEKVVVKLFFDFLECFSSLKEEKLDFPKEFQHDVHTYLDGNLALVNKFEDIEMRYLMLSDFYDFCRITKRYTKEQ